MISITSITGSSPGVIFEENGRSNLTEIEPRVSKSKTLDGGVVFDHRGFVTADRELDIKASVDSDQASALEYLAKNETFTNLACDVGFFEGTIARLVIQNGEADFIFWVKQ